MKKEKGDNNNAKLNGVLIANKTDLEDRRIVSPKIGSELAGQLGMISYKKSLITIFGHQYKIKNFIKKFDIFHKKFSILVYIWNKMAKFESKLHLKMIK